MLVNKYKKAWNCLKRFSVYRNLRLRCKGGDNSLQLVARTAMLALSSFTSERTATVQRGVLNGLDMICSLNLDGALTWFNWHNFVVEAIPILTKLTYSLSSIYCMFCVFRCEVNGVIEIQYLICNSCYHKACWNNIKAYQDFSLEVLVD